MWNVTGTKMEQKEDLGMGAGPVCSYRDNIEKERMWTYRQVFSNVGDLLLGFLGNPKAPHLRQSFLHLLSPPRSCFPHEREDSLQPNTTHNKNSLHTSEPKNRRVTDDKGKASVSCDARDHHCYCQPLILKIRINSNL